MFGKEFDRFNVATWSDDTGLLLAASPSSQQDEGRLQTATMKVLPVAAAVASVTVVSIAVEAQSLIGLFPSNCGEAAWQYNVVESDAMVLEPDFTPRPREITPEFRKASLARILHKWKVGLYRLA